MDLTFGIEGEKNVPFTMGHHSGIICGTKALPTTRGNIVGKIDKLCEKFFRKPIPNDITFNEVKTLFTHFGCDIIQGGRHPKVVHKASGTVISVSRHGDSVKEYCVKQLRDLLEMLLEEEK